MAKTTEFGKARVLVVGAAPTSLGHFVQMACKSLGFEVHTAGIQGEEFDYDVTDSMEDHEELMELVALRAGRVDHVIYTAGINNMTGIATPWEDYMREHMAVNYEGYVKCFQAWALIHGPTDGEVLGASCYRHFVAISSNSANIARTDSLPYCASKAALSMAIRCLARQYAESYERRMVIYGYEPGWLDNTPMSNDILATLNRSEFDKPHRIPGNDHGVNPARLADLIAHNLTVAGRMLNGTLLRVDGGEQ